MDGACSFFNNVADRSQVNQSKNKPPLDTGKHTATTRANETYLLRRRLLILGGTFFVMSALGIATWVLARDTTPSVQRVEVVKAYPHDRLAFCQGLVFVDGQLYEGTGNYGKSTLRKVELETGKVLQQVPLDKKLFGEGITIWEDRILQLTWKAGIGIIYEKDSLKEVDRFPLRVREGWGLTHDGQHLILSSGSAVLQFLDPDTFRVVRRLTVRNRGARVKHLNELEYVNGEILANVWKRDYIARISPKTGNVNGWIDLRQLKPAELRRDPNAVLNGIAYDAENDRLFVTGKYWPQLFEIQFNEK